MARVNAGPSGLGFGAERWREMRAEEARCGVVGCVSVLHPTLRKGREGWGTRAFSGRSRVGHPAIYASDCIEMRLERVTAWYWSPGGLRQKIIF